MADAEGLRSRLEALNRGPLPAGAIASAVRAAAGDAKQAPAAPRPAAEAASPSLGSAWRAGVVRALPGLVRRGECAATDLGECWRIALAVDELWPGGEDLVRRRCAVLADEKPASGGEADRKVACDVPWWEGMPAGLALLDLETCGLAGSAVFLAGVLREVDGRLAVELLLARDYSEEPAVLAALWQRLAGVGTLVTFNGKSFDWPMVVDRSRRHLLARGVTVAPPRHVDLLHLARRRWRGELPDCKLQTLEQRVCGRQRADDLPSHMIPAAYQQYVRTRFEREMDQVLLHNAVDLVTMLDLAMRLAG
jgi:hypothetical protein